MRIGSKFNSSKLLPIACQLIQIVNNVKVIYLFNQMEPFAAVECNEMCSVIIWYTSFNRHLSKLIIAGHTKLPGIHLAQERGCWKTDTFCISPVFCSIHHF
jgi:hypothetical protein